VEKMNKKILTGMLAVALLAVVAFPVATALASTVTATNGVGSVNGEQDMLQLQVQDRDQLRLRDETCDGIGNQTQQMERQMVQNGSCLNEGGAQQRIQLGAQYCASLHTSSGLQSLVQARAQSCIKAGK
jgi:hypothetical protein